MGFCGGFYAVKEKYLLEPSSAVALNQSLSTFASVIHYERKLKIGPMLRLSSQRSFIYKMAESDITSKTISLLFTNTDSPFQPYEEPAKNSMPKV